MDGIERVTTLEMICSDVYYRLLEDERLREDIWYTSYDIQRGIKYIIVDLVEYFIVSYNPYGVWDKRIVDLLIKTHRPKATHEQLEYFPRTVRSVLNTTLGIFENGHKLAYRFDGKILRFQVLTPKRLGYG